MNEYEAYNSICNQLKTKFEDGLTNGIPQLNISPLTFVDIKNVEYVPEIEWQRVGDTDRAPFDKHWLRLTTKTVTRKQSSITNEFGTTQYTTYGLVIVQMFFSKVKYDTVACASLEMIVQNAFTKSTDPGLIFRNSTPKKIDAEVNYFQTNVTCDYEFDTVLR